MIAQDLKQVGTVHPRHLVQQYVETGSEEALRSVMTDYLTMKGVLMTVFQF